MIEKIASEVLLVAGAADADDLRDELTKNGITFIPAKADDARILGFDIASLIPWAIPAGSFAGLATVLSAYLKHRKRTLHVKMSNGKFEMHSENFSREEVLDLLQKAGPSGQIWMLDNRNQRPVQRPERLASPAAKKNKRAAEQERATSKPREKRPSQNSCSDNQNRHNQRRTTAFLKRSVIAISAWSGFVGNSALWINL